MLFGVKDNITIEIASEFLFTTGIENSYPMITLEDGTRHRVDEMEKCGHYARWKDDFDLVTELGVSALRYGPPYYKTLTAPGQYDWAFADEERICQESSMQSVF